MKKNTLKLYLVFVMLLSTFVGKAQEKDYSTIHFSAIQKCKNSISISGGFQLPTFTNSIKDKTTPEKIAEWKKLVYIVETN